MAAFLNQNPDMLNDMRYDPLYSGNIRHQVFEIFHVEQVEHPLLVQHRECRVERSVDPRRPNQCLLLYIDVAFAKDIGFVNLDVILLT